MVTDKTNQQVKLKDGRLLGYAEYGSPDGKPVFYFHGHPGSRRDWPVFDDDGCAAELNARIIAVDRPGHGLSDFKRGREILDWPDDVIEIADALDRNGNSMWNGPCRSARWQGRDRLEICRWEVPGDAKANADVDVIWLAEKAGEVRFTDV